MSNNTQRPRANTLGELDLHLGYIQDELSKVVEALPNMATKNDIQALERRMDAFATKAELKSVEDRLQAETVASTFDRWVSAITKLGSAAAVVVAFFAAIAALVHFVDKVPK